MIPLLHNSEFLSICNVLLFLFVFLVVYHYIKNKPPKNFPPGPRSLPFIGDLHHIDFDKIHLEFFKLAEKYGHIFSIRAFGERMVVLNGHKLVREVFVKQGDPFGDRPSIPLFADIYGNKGLVASYGYAWKQQRRFALHTLKNFGLGKRSLEPRILQECSYLSEAFANEQGKPFNPKGLLNNAVSNIICVLVFGNRFEYTDNDFKSLLKNMNDAISLEGSMWCQFYNMVPWLLRLVPGPHKELMSLWNKVIDFVKSKIEEHRADCNPSAPRDYIDCFLGEMEKVGYLELGLHRSDIWIGYRP